MAESEPCIICKRPAETVATTLDEIQQRCPRCGYFGILRTCLGAVSRLAEKQRLLLSGWAREQSDLGDVPLINREKIASAAAGRLPRLMERVDKLLYRLASSQEALGEEVALEGADLLAITYSRDPDEFDYIVGVLDRDGYISDLTKDGRCQITPSGYLRAEELQGRHTKSQQAFVAMSFHSSMAAAYAEGFEPAIRSAGYDPVRVDRIEHAGKIDDEIIARIRQSRFVVADFTGHRAGVYFEAGFALGLTLPVIWTCRQDDFEKLHFDIRQFNCISWTDTPDLAKGLQTRIEAVIGVGPRR